MYGKKIHTSQDYVSTRIKNRMCGIKNALLTMDPFFCCVWLKEKEKKREIPEKWRIACGDYIRERAARCGFLALAHKNIYHKYVYIRVVRTSELGKNPYEIFRTFEIGDKFFYCLAITIVGDVLLSLWLIIKFFLN